MLERKIMKNFVVSLILSVLVARFAAL